MQKRKENLIRTVLLILLVSCLLFVMYSSVSEKRETVKSYYGDQVTFQMNNEEPKQVNLTDYIFDLPQKGDKITLTNVLPEANIMHPVLIIKVYHTVLDCYLDGELYYTYGREMYEKDQVLGHEYLRIALPDNYAGKEIRLEMTFTESNSVSSLSNFYVISAEDNYKESITKHYMTWMTSITLIVVGIVAVVASVTRKRFNQDIQTMAWLSFFAIGISLWMLCNENLLFLIVDDMRICNVIEYFALYLTPIPTGLFFANVHADKKRMRRVFLFWSGATALLNVAVIFTQVTGMEHYVNWLTYAQLMMAGEVVLIIYSLFRSFKTKKANQKVMAYGMVFMGIVIGLELLRYVASKYGGVNHWVEISLVPLGSFVFVVSMAYGYLMEFFKSYYSRTEQKILEKMAYTDLLTNVYNRNYCEKIMDEMETERQPGFLVVLDLNELKYVNDNLGHQAGDELLVSFTQILQEVFPEDCISRMGGDEFAVILSDKTEDTVKFHLQQLDKSIEKKNKQGSRLSAAYGYAYYDGQEETVIRKVYREADAKMYACKKLMKGNRSRARN